VPIRLFGAAVLATTTRPRGRAGPFPPASKLAAGTASQGWAVLTPGTPVTDVRVVTPWRLRLGAWWKKLRAFAGHK
jgi:hypothetical protein